MEIDVLGALYLVTGLSTVLPDGETRLDAPPPPGFGTDSPTKREREGELQSGSFFSQIVICGLFKFGFFGW